MVEELEAATPRVVIVNVALVAPLGTVTVARTVATDVLLLAKLTTAPLEGAFPLKVTVPVELLPPTTEVGVIVKVDRIAALTVRVALLLTPYVPVMVTEVLVATPLVVTAKVAVVAPAATVTPAGTVAAAVLLLAKATRAPPAGARPVSVTVPVELDPPVRVLGLNVTDDKVTATEVKFTPVTLAPLTETLLVAGVKVKPFLLGVTE